MHDTGKIHRCSPHRMKLYFPTVSDVAEEEELLADSPVQLPGIPALPSEWLFGTPTGECESHTHCDTQVTLDDCRQSLQAWPPAAEGHIGKTGDQQPITSSSVNIAQPLAAPSKRSLADAVRILQAAHRAKAQTAAGSSKVGKVGQNDNSPFMVAVDTQAQVSIISALAVPHMPLEPSPWHHVADFSGQSSLKVLGQVMLTILGIPTPFQVLEGYKGNALLGDPFLSYPGVIISSDRLSIQDLGGVDLNHFKISLEKLLNTNIASVKFATPKYAPGQEPCVADLVHNQKLHPTSFGLGKHDVAKMSPLSYEQIEQDCRTHIGFLKWVEAFNKAREEWVVPDRSS
eukprot:jgi/Mesvir1/28464/Mv25584-RA.1